MPFEEARIKCQLEYSDRYNYAHVRIEADSGDDFCQYFQIVVPYEYEGERVIGESQKDIDQELKEELRKKKPLNFSRKT